MPDSLECNAGQHDRCPGYGEPQESLADDLPECPVDCDCVCHFDGRGTPAMVNHSDGVDPDSCRACNALVAKRGSQVASDVTTPTPIEMVEDLHRAVYGDTWARPESPAVVWEMLLEQVRGLASGWCGECIRRSQRQVGHVHDG